MAYAAFLSVAVLALAASQPCLSTQVSASDKGEFDEPTSLLQSELATRSSSAAASPKAGGAKAPSVCEQLGEDGSCAVSWDSPSKAELPLMDTVDIAAAAVPAKEEPVEGSSMARDCINFMILLVVFDGLRRYSQKTKAAKATTAKGEGDDWSELMQAIMSNKSNALALVTENTDMMRKDAWGCTLLHAAARGGSVALVKKLITRGARAQEADVWDETPLHLAARAGNADVCEVLLAYGAKVDATSLQEWTPLVVAGHEGHEAVCKFLLGRGASVGDLSDDELPPMLASLLDKPTFQAMQDQGSEHERDVYGGAACDDEY